MQFAMIPMNLLGRDGTADYIVSGRWSDRAAREAARIGHARVAADSGAKRPAEIPEESELSLSPRAAYVHLTSNETVSGIQWKNYPETAAPLVADMTSDIFTRPLDVGQFGLIYAGAQKNLGPSGTALVAIRRDIAERAEGNIPNILRYKTLIEENSLYNTPSCFSVYIIMLVSRWMLKTGLEELYRRNRIKAERMYAVLDASGFYRPSARRECRSEVNVTFTLPDERLEEIFLSESESNGLKNLKGHRSFGGIRASIYNAFPIEGVNILADFMKEFERKYG